MFSACCLGKHLQTSSDKKENWLRKIINSLRSIYSKWKTYNVLLLTSLGGKKQKKLEKESQPLKHSDYRYLSKTSPEVLLSLQLLSSFWSLHASGKFWFMLFKPDNFFYRLLVQITQLVHVVPERGCL